MIYKTTSVKRVIAKVFTDLNLKEEDHRISDMIEWSGEALLKIGAFPSLITRVTGKDETPIIQLSDYQARLPGDLHRVIQVAYSQQETGPFYPMRYATGSFDHPNPLNTDEETSVDDTAINTVAETELVNLVMDIYDLTYAEALAKLNNEPGTRSLLVGLLGGGTRVSGAGTEFTSDYTYMISPGYIKTNMRDGYLLMSYLAVPVDKDGFPLIPDDESFMEAIYWYINMKLMYPEWKEGRVRDAVYYDSRRSWNYYCKQAYGNAMMPNLDQLESIKNTWVTLVPRMNEHDTFYSATGERDYIHNANE